MITRIKYSKTKNGFQQSFNIPIAHKLIVQIQIYPNFEMSIVKVTEKTQRTLYTEICVSDQHAKRRARKKLEEMGMNFNNEIRRKK